jgi:hypothetical protein
LKVGWRSLKVEGLKVAIRIAGAIVYEEEG